MILRTSTAHGIISASAIDRRWLLLANSSRRGHDHQAQPPARDARLTPKLPSQAPSSRLQMLSAHRQRSCRRQAEFERTELLAFLCHHSSLQGAQGWRVSPKEDGQRHLAPQDWVRFRSRLYSYATADIPSDVQVTLQILTALIDKAPRDVPLYAPYVMSILSQVLKSRDITLVESSNPTFAAFCAHHDGASLSADQQYAKQYAQIVNMYTDYASTRLITMTAPVSAPLMIRWRNAGLAAIRSIAVSDALSGIAGRQLDTIIPVILENLWSEEDGFLNILERRARQEESTEAQKNVKRRASTATVRTVETSDLQAAAGSTAAADKLAEEDTGLLAMQCLKQLFVVNNRGQIYHATSVLLDFITNQISTGHKVIEHQPSQNPSGWAIELLELVARWTPVQDRFVILVVTMDTLTRSGRTDAGLQHELILTMVIGALLRSDINFIGLSIMDILLGLLQKLLRTLQCKEEALAKITTTTRVVSSLGQPVEPESAEVKDEALAESSEELAQHIQSCIGNLANHIYYADQISDMVSAIILRLRLPVKLEGAPNSSNNASPVRDSIISSNGSPEEIIDAYFTTDSAKIKAMAAVKEIMVLADRHAHGSAGTSKNRIPLRVWEGTQWLLRHNSVQVRRAYVDAFLFWLERETTRQSLLVREEKPQGLKRSSRGDSAVNLPRRAVSTAVAREKSTKSIKTTFLPLLHLAIYENVHQFVQQEDEIVLLHLILVRLIQHLGVNAARYGIPMIYQLQEDIMDVEDPQAKIHIGSLCHGYFWALSEHFDFESSSVGRIIQMEILRRRKKSLWVDRICMPPVTLAQIHTSKPAAGSPKLPLEELETESLKPCDERFPMVKLISLAYEETMLASPPASPAASPGRVITQPILRADVFDSDRSMPEYAKDQMMAPWSKESVLQTLHESNKTVSLSGSRSGTTNTNTAHRNFLAVNGFTSGTNSGSNSPKEHHIHPLAMRQRPDSAYGLASGLGPVGKLRQGSTANTPSGPSESSRNSITRIDQLKRILSAQHASIAPAAERPPSDASSESVASCNMTASEFSYAPTDQVSHTPAKPHSRASSISRGDDRKRSRSMSRERNGDHDGLELNPLASNPVDSTPTSPASSPQTNGIPPVPPLPESDAVQQAGATKAGALPGRGPKSLRRTKSSINDRHDEVEGSKTSRALQNLLKGIDSGADDFSEVRAIPPY